MKQLTSVLSGRLAVAALWLLTAAPAGAMAQSLAFARLDGVVLAPDRRPVQHAEVRAEDRSGGATRWTVTARDGVFRFDVLPEGRYDLVVEALGFRSVRHVDVHVGVGHPTRLEVFLHALGAAPQRVDTVARQAGAGSRVDWMLARRFGDLPGERRLSSDIAALTTIADENSVEGLPWRLTESVIDGTRVGGGGAPSGAGADAAGLALPVRAISTASLGGLGYDVEVGGSGVGIRAITRRGGRAPSAQPMIEGGSANIGAGFVVSGPLHGDTAHALIGVDYQRGERDFAPLTAGIPLRVTDRAGFFGRLDWQQGDRLAISARVTGSRLTSTGEGERSGLASLYGHDYEALGGQASVDVFSRLSARVAHEWRVSADLGVAEGQAGGAPRADYTIGSLGLGPILQTPFEERRATPRLSGMLHFDLAAHQLKVGFATAAHSFDSRFARDGDGVFVFGDADGPGPNTSWRGVDANSFAGAFRMRETALFIQDAWHVVDGLSLMLGARLDNMRLPTGSLELNQNWLTLTAVDNTDVDAKRSSLSPRIGFRWEIGAQRDWVIEGGAGTYQDLPDRRDIAEALTLDRAADVRYGVGVSSYPTRPSALEAPVIGRTMTLLAPSFVAPRTQRLSLGITRRLGSWSSSLGALYRHTDFLSRRRDLNLPLAAVGVDQHGRLLMGVLRQSGAALAAIEQSNRRFAGFDGVHVLESSGVSDFWGLTAGIERVRDIGLSLTAEYTYSRTTDNVAGFAGAGLMPFADGLAGQDWLEGTSDYDVPHRVLVAADWRPIGAFSITAIYRLRSGTPFTPALRAGVDANGDGDWSNDPAFVDASLSGMDALLERESCLRGSVGAFAERNSCRGELVHRLDLRATVRLARLTIGQVDLMVDALDIVAPNAGPIDRALLLVDPAAATTTNALTGVTTVPYVTNPNFGRRLYDVTPGVFWRMGLRITP